MNDLSPAQKEAYARAKSSVVDLFSFELRHSAFPQPIRMISYDCDVRVRLEDYAPANPGEVVDFMGVAFKAPQESINTEPGNNFSVSVGGISSQALPYLAVASDSLEPISATVRYVALDTRLLRKRDQVPRLDAVIGVSRPSEMQVKNVSVSMLVVQMTLGFTNLSGRTLDV
ncbi:hypothetical protein [Cellvibrio mixtus]|uniref:hypothetical protein n=1 Tax=Cellvibrio mixtus TaxID=39650 RepID=UPI0006948C79|nr:hypothetical protein [Cellvibrio mixtus]